MERIDSQAGAIALDDTYFPFLIVTWMGVGAVAHAEAYVAWVARMTERVKPGTTLMIINDASRATRPGAEFRKFFSDFLGNAQGRSLLIVDPVTLVVIDNPLVRGALTAIGWMAPSVRDLVVTKDLRSAFVAAAEASAERGCAVESPNLEDYTHPADRTEVRD